jgi:hypothetical protein
MQALLKKYLELEVLPMQRSELVTHASPVQFKGPGLRVLKG